MYATDVNIDNPVHRQSERDHQPVKSIPGHPDDASSLIDAAGVTPTARTARVEQELDATAESADSLQGQINSLLAAQNGGAVPIQKQSFVAQPMPPAPFENLEKMYAARNAQHRLTNKGSVISDVYHPWTIIQRPPQASEVTLPMLLANQCHLGHATALWHPGNSNYIFGIRDGIHIISLEITLSYLRRAAKVVQEVARRGGIILFVGTRKSQREIIVNAANIAKPAYHIFSRWIPGSLTNGQQILDRCAIKVVTAQDKELEQYRAALSTASHPVMRPDLVICMNPLENEVCLHECGLYNVPTIGIVDTDVNPSWVTYPIPANDDSLRSVALISGVLARAAKQGQKMRKELAAEGKVEYSTLKVQRFMQRLDEIAKMESTQESEVEGETKKGTKGRDEDD